MPIHCSELTDIIYEVISKKKETNIIECIGPEVLTLKDIVLILLKLIDKKRFLVNMPFFLANLSANFFQIFPIVVEIIL